MNKAFFITLLSGISFIIGYFITKRVKNKEKLNLFSIGFAFSIMICLILFDLLPETLELLEKEYLLIVVFMATGFMILKIFDLFIPEHHNECNHSVKSTTHIGLITAVALILHNIIEGLAIYSVSLNSTKLGLLMSASVFAHNLPLGIQVSSMMGERNKLKIPMIFVLCFSAVFGVLIMNISNIVLSDFALGVFISITLGMILYIVVCELFKEVREHIKSKTVVLGIILGFLIIFISSLL